MLIFPRKYLSVFSYVIGVVIGVALSSDADEHHIQPSQASGSLSSQSDGSSVTELVEHLDALPSLPDQTNPSSFSLASRESSPAESDTEKWWYQVVLQDKESGLWEEEYAAKQTAAESNPQPPVDNGSLADAQNYFFKFVKTIISYYFLPSSGHTVLSSNTKAAAQDADTVQPALEVVAPEGKSRSSVKCKVRQSIPGHVNRVNIMNDTALQGLFKSERQTNDTEESEESVCQALLLYTPWCPFSAKIAPHFNALSRAFPDLDVLAINAVTLNYWNARFGTVAVPNVLLFQNGKFVTRFNHTVRSLETLTWFVQNSTNLRAVESVTVEEHDFDGPVPSQPETDWDVYLVLSWIAIGIALVHLSKRFHAFCSALYHRVAEQLVQPDHEHQHVD